MQIPGGMSAILPTPLNIGGLVLANRVFLAPMSGVTDRAFRRLAWRFGAGLVFSEMVASEALVLGNAEMQFSWPGENPIGCGSQPKWRKLLGQIS
jgi:tRNA-dihydrouridine synthase